MDEISANYRATDITGSALNLHFVLDAVGDIAKEGANPGGRKGSGSFSQITYQVIRRHSNGSRNVEAAERICLPVHLHVNDLHRCARRRCTNFSKPIEAGTTNSAIHAPSVNCETSTTTIAVAVISAPKALISSRTHIPSGVPQ